jgi:hypothetical protein
MAEVEKEEKMALKDMDEAAFQAKMGAWDKTHGGRGRAKDRDDGAGLRAYILLACLQHPNLLIWRSISPISLDSMPRHVRGLHYDQHHEDGGDLPFRWE